MDEDPITKEEDTKNVTPKIKRVSIFSKDNPKQIIEDIHCEIIQDSIIECWPRYIIEDKNLVAHFDWQGDSLFVDGKRVIGDEYKYDYRKPIEVRVSSKDITNIYTLLIHSYTGLPVIWIETNNRTPITSKEEYITAQFKLTEDVVTRAAGDVIECDVNVKGRGNNTWELQPKKSYRLKFNENVPLLSEEADKSWVLLANYYDKSLIRGATVFYLGQISRLTYTPKYHYVELFLNGRYEGNYQLIDKLKISPNRLNIGKEGFLIEADRYAEEEKDARYFKIKSLAYPLNIKDPDIEYDSDEYEFVKNYFEETENVLYSDSFANPIIGWQNYIDLDSAVDWYIINEICKSCEHFCFLGYFNLQRGGKLNFGPLWDYDKCFGNYAPYYGCEQPEGFWVKNCEWFTRLFEDPFFVETVKKRFQFFYNNREIIFREINANAAYLKYSIIENDNRWGILYNPNYQDPHDNDIWGNYYNEVTSLKKWIFARFEWLRKELEIL